MEQTSTSAKAVRLEIAAAVLATVVREPAECYHLDPTDSKSLLQELRLLTAPPAVNPPLVIARLVLRRPRQQIQCQPGSPRTALVAVLKA